MYICIVCTYIYICLAMYGNLRFFHLDWCRLWRCHLMKHVRALLVCIVQVHTYKHTCARSCPGSLQYICNVGLANRQHMPLTSLDIGQLSSFAPPSLACCCLCQEPERWIVYLGIPNYMRETESKRRRAKKRAHIIKLTSSIEMMLHMTMLFFFFLFVCLPKKSST